jgi:hypothetical protein
MHKLLLIHNVLFTNNYIIFKVEILNYLQENGVTNNQGTR